MREHLFSIDEAENDLLQSATYLAESIGSSDGHAEAMKEIVTHFVEKGDVDSAAHLANTVDDPFVRDRLLLQVAEKCAAVDDDEYALQLVDAIEETGFQSVALERLAMRKASIGEFDKAFELTETLKHSSDALAVIAAEQAAGGLIEESDKTLSQIEFPYTKVNALLNIAAYYENENEREKALTAVERAVDAARDVEFREEKIRALQDAAAHFLQVGANDRAIESLAAAREEAEMLDGVHRENFLSGIALSFLRAGSLELAERTLDLISDKVLIATTLAGYAAHFDAQGERDDALETLEEAYQILKSQSDREVRNSREKFNIFASIAVQFARFDKIERALEIASEISDESARRAALSRIAIICVERDQDDLAHQAIDLIDENSDRLFALLEMSDVKRNAEKTDDARKYLIEVKSEIETVPQYSSRVSALNQLAERFHALGETEAARASAGESLKTVAQIRDESQRAVSVLHLADLFKSLDFTLGDDERDLLRTMMRKSEW